VEQSAGSGYAVDIPPLVWAFALATGSALLTAVLASRLYLRYYDDPDGALWVGAACLVEWHLAWAAVSGMEITLFTALTLLFLEMLARGAAAERLGLVTGLMGLVRPEGLLLGSLYGMRILRLDGWGAKARAWYALPFSRGDRDPLGLFNCVWRTTLSQHHGCQVWAMGLALEPTEGIQVPWSVVAYLAMGPLLLLLPFVVQAIVRAVRGRDKRLVALAWIAILVLVYAVTVPVIYHHGRYLMPLLPLVIVMGMGELRRWRATRWAAMRRILPWLVGPCSLSCG